MFGQILWTLNERVNSIYSSSVQRNKIDLVIEVKYLFVYLCHEKEFNRISSHTCELIVSNPPANKRNKYALVAVGRGGHSPRIVDILMNGSNLGFCKRHGIVLRFHTLKIGFSFRFIISQAHTQCLCAIIVITDPSNWGWAGLKVFLRGVAAPHPSVVVGDHYKRDGLLVWRSHLIWSVRDPKTF